MTTVVEYHSTDTALVLVDPCNDFLSEGGKAWPSVQDVAESAGTVGHRRELLGAVRQAEMALGPYTLRGTE